MEVRGVDIVKVLKFAGDAVPVTLELLQEVFKFLNKRKKDGDLSERVKACEESLKRMAETSDGKEATEVLDVPADVVEELKKEVNQIIPEMKSLVYAGCVVFMFDVPLSKEQKTMLEAALANDGGVWDSDFYNDLQAKIAEFYYDYAVDCYDLAEDSVAINFMENRIYADEDFRRFAGTLNKVLGRGTYITQYMVV